MSFASRPPRAGTSPGEGARPYTTAGAATAGALPRLQTYAALVVSDAALVDAGLRARALDTLDEVTRAEALGLPPHLLARLFVLRPRRLSEALHDGWGMAGPPPPLPVLEVCDRIRFAESGAAAARIRAAQERVAALLAAAAALGECLAAAPSDDPNAALMRQRLRRRADHAVGALACPALRMRLPEPLHWGEHARPGLAEEDAWATRTKLSICANCCSQKSDSVRGTQDTLAQLAGYLASLPACPTFLEEVLDTWALRCVEAEEAAWQRMRTLSAEAEIWQQLYPPPPDDLEELLDAEIAQQALAQG